MDMKHFRMKSIVQCGGEAYEKVKEDEGSFRCTALLCNMDRKCQSVVQVCVCVCVCVCDLQMFLSYILVKAFKGSAAVWATLFLSSHTNKNTHIQS